MVIELGLNRLNTYAGKETKKTDFYFIIGLNSLTKQKEKDNCILQETMADAEMSAEEERHPENPLNNEEGNLKDGEILVDLNDIQDN